MTKRPREGVWDPLAQAFAVPKFAVSTNRSPTKVQGHPKDGVLGIVNNERITVHSLPPGC